MSFTTTILFALAATLKKVADFIDVTEKIYGHVAALAPGFPTNTPMDPNAINTAFAQLEATDTYLAGLKILLPRVQTELERLRAQGGAADDKKRIDDLTAQLTEANGFLTRFTGLAAKLGAAAAVADTADNPIEAALPVDPPPVTDPPPPPVEVPPVDPVPPGNGETGTPPPGNGDSGAGAGDAGATDPNGGGGTPPPAGDGEGAGTPPGGDTSGNAGSDAGNPPADGTGSSGATPVAGG